MRSDPPPSSPTDPPAPASGSGENASANRVRAGWLRTFAAFRHRNYRLYFVGQLVSLIGTWLQMVAEGWLVYDLSHSELVLGVVRFLHTLPFTILTIVGGAIADRFEKRRVLLVTQSAAMFLAFLLAALVSSGVVQVWHVGVIGCLLGVVGAVDVPVRQSFLVDLVGKEDLMNGIALNSSMFNGARVVGPALAGLLIGLIGIGGCILLNAFSFAAVLAAYLLIRLPPSGPRLPSQSLRQATAEAFRFVRGNPVLRVIMSLVAVFSLFGWTYTVLMPAFARDVLGVDASGFGMLLAANGCGALVGALSLASFGHRFPRRRLIFGGAAGFCAMLLLFALSRNLVLSAAILVLAGFCMIVFLSTANTSVQLRSPDQLRGRIMGLYTLAFVGLSPFGSLIAGGVAHVLSAPVAIATGAGLCALATLVAWRLAPPEEAGVVAGEKQAL